MGVWGAVKKGLGIVGKIAKIAPIPYANYLGIAFDAIGLVEEAVGKGSGKLKKELAKKLVLESIRAYEAMSGKDIVDEKKLLNALDGTIDVLVTILNDFDLWNRILPSTKEN